MMTIHRGGSKTARTAPLHKTMPQAVYHRLDVCIFVRRMSAVSGVRISAPATAVKRARRGTGGGASRLPEPSSVRAEE